MVEPMRTDLWRPPIKRLQADDAIEGIRTGFGQPAKNSDNRSRIIHKKKP